MDASISSSELLSAIREGRSPLVIDVRRRPAFRSATEMISGALWRDPERVADWAAELPRDDHEMLRHGMVMYDALYAWCKGGQEGVAHMEPRRLPVKGPREKSSRIHSSHFRIGGRHDEISR